MNPPAKPKLLPKPGSVKVLQALYSYQAIKDDELSFEEGDVLYVFEQNPDGWWKAKCKGKTGLIPYNYVTEKTEIKHPLHEAARRGNLAFLEENLNNGVSATGIDAMGNTALYWSAHSGHLDCVARLLDVPNPSVNAQNNLGDTALHAAATKGHLQIVELLIENGADLGLKNKNNENPEDLAFDPAVKNFLQLNRPSRNSRPATINPEDYEDDSDG